MSQTAYSLAMTVSTIGQLADAGENDIVTGDNSGTGEVALFGHLMSWGAANNQIVRPAAAGSITATKKIAGVVVAGQDIPSDSTVTDPQYPIKSAVPCLRKGRIWVRSEDAVTVGTTGVFVRYAGTGNLGAFRATTVMSEAAEIPEGSARWLTNTTAANQLAILEINL